METATTNQQRSRRHLLKRYYGLAADSTGLDSTSDLQLNDLDARGFDKTRYLHSLLKESSLLRLIQTNNHLCQDIKHLESEARTLMYENYGKYLEAAKEIQGNSQHLTLALAKLEKVSQNQHLLSEKVQNLEKDQFHQQRTTLVEYDKQEQMLRKLQSILELPNDLKNAVEESDWLKCVQLHRVSLAVFEMYNGNLMGLYQIQQESKLWLNKVELALWQELEQNPPPPAELICKYVGLLAGLEQTSPLKLFEKTLQVINRRLSVLESLDLTLPNFSPNDVTFLSELILTMDCLEFCFFDHKNISTRDSGNNRGWFHIALEKEDASRCQLLWKKEFTKKITLFFNNLQQRLSVLPNDLIHGDINELLNRLNKLVLGVVEQLNKTLGSCQWGYDLISEKLKGCFLECRRYYIRSVFQQVQHEYLAMLKTFATNEKSINVYDFVVQVETSLTDTLVLTCLPIFQIFLETDQHWPNSFAFSEQVRLELKSFWKKLCEDMNAISLSVKPSCWLVMSNLTLDFESAAVQATQDAYFSALISVKTLEHEERVAQSWIDDVQACSIYAGDIAQDMLCKYVDRVASELMPFIEETLKIFNVEQEDDINGDAEIGNAWGVIMKKLKVMEEDIIWLFGEEEQVEALTTSSTVKEEAQITEQQQINERVNRKNRSRQSSGSSLLAFTNKKPLISPRSFGGEFRRRHYRSRSASVNQNEVKAVETDSSSYWLANIEKLFTERVPIYEAQIEVSREGILTAILKILFKAWSEWLRLIPHIKKPQAILQQTEWIKLNLKEWLFSSTAANHKGKNVLYELLNEIAASAKGRNGGGI